MDNSSFSIELVIIITSVTIICLVTLMIFFYVMFIKKKTQLVVNQLKRESEFEQELIQAQIEIKEQTLSYIGRELHDDLGQKLSVVRLQHNQMLYKMEGEQQKELSEINELLRECIQDIRNLSKTLITEQVEHFGLIDTLQLEVKRLKKLNYIQIHFTFNEHDIDINSKYALILFRMIQESINNCLKHAKATELHISVVDAENELKINVKDNGKGFENDTVYKGSGMKNLTNRALLLQAKLEIHSSKNEGTHITITYLKSP